MIRGEVISKRRTVIILSGLVGITLIGYALYLFLFFYLPTINLDVSGDNSGKPVYVSSTYGNFDTPLNRPMDVMLLDEKLYVTDTMNKRVQVFDKNGDFEFLFENKQKGENTFLFPYGITCDKEKRIYVSDMYTGKISIFDKNGKYLRDFVEQDQIYPVILSPSAIRIYNEKLYVPDVKRCKVYVFSLLGDKLFEIDGNEDLPFEAPNAVAVDLDGNICVSDSGNNRILKFSEEGKFLNEIGLSENNGGISMLTNPRGLAVTNSNILIVVDSLSNEVYGFKKDGKKAFSIGEGGEAVNPLALPNGLFIDENNNIYITNTGNGRVDIYR